MHARNKDDYTPLFHALKSGNVEVVAFLVQQGADVHTRNKDGCTPLCCAASSSNLEIVKFLVKQGAHVNVTNKDHGMYGRSVAIVKYLKGKYPHAVDEGGKSLLHAATSLKHLDVLESLADQGADLHAKDRDGKNLLYYAVGTGNLELVKVVM